jgi:hypothetical protein
MSLSYVSLELTPPWHNGGGVILVRATDGIRLSRKGSHEKIPTHRAYSCMDGGRKPDMDSVRSFVARARLLRSSLSSFSDQELLSHIRNWLRTEELVVLQEYEGGGEVSHLVEQRRLVAEIERKTRKRLSYSGRQYKFVADTDLRRLGDRDRYEVVNREEAKWILDGLIDQIGDSTGSRKLLAKARDMLTRDWRPPLFPDGLILLRRIPEQTAPTTTWEPPITPSQYANLLKPKTWIEIEVLYEDNSPYTGPHLIAQAGSNSSAGSLDGNGFWGKYEIDPGTYAFSLPPAQGEEEEPEDEANDEANEAKRVRLIGMLFDANKCFLLPQGLPGIKNIIAMHKKNPDAKVLIVGHAGGDEDLAGLDMAVGRAEMLTAYLTGKPEKWLDWFSSKKQTRVRWGTREVQLMLSALPEGGAPFYEGNAPGITDAATIKAIKAFQKYANDKLGAKLAVDGKGGPQTLKALVKAYMDIEDTTLGNDIVPVTHGCEGHFDDTLTEDGLQPDDRRIEVFFFEKEIMPAPEGDTSSEGASDYPGWVERLKETDDYEYHGIHVQIVDANKRPVPGAIVQLTGPTSHESTSDDHGYVSFSDLKAGKYKVHSEKKGRKIRDSAFTYPTAKTVQRSQASGC